MCSLTVDSDDHVGLHAEAQQQIAEKDGMVF